MIPVVSVVMPVYNAEAYIGEALESMIRQTFRAFELIAVDDGSTDESAAILERYQRRDPRLTILRLDHGGIVAALNAGIERSAGAFVARMDADDIALPRRLERQVSFMRRHPEIGVCGCWLRSIGEGPAHEFRYETRHGEIVASLVFDSPMPHPASVFRTDVLRAPEGRYRDDYPNTEDYDLWTRLSTMTRLANIPRVMYLYRQYPAQVTRSRPNHQREFRRMHLARLGIVPTESEAALHDAIARWTFPRDPATLERIHAWLIRLFEANNSARVFDLYSFESILIRRWMTILHYFTHHGFNVIRPYRDSPLHHPAAASFRQGMSLPVKFLLRLRR